MPRLSTPTTPASSVSPRRRAAPRARPRPAPASPPRRCLPLLRRLLHCNRGAAPLPTATPE
uniref:Uncharacterized protein n=1 Tax=Oryza punctata TaxID=4537 RepID=A0A0E0K7Z7_ORYPU